MNDPHLTAEAGFVASSHSSAIASDTSQVLYRVHKASGLKLAGLALLEIFLA